MVKHVQEVLTNESAMNLWYRNSDGTATEKLAVNLITGLDEHIATNYLAFEDPSDGLGVTMIPHSSIIKFEMYIPEE